MPSRFRLARLAALATIGCLGLGGLAAASSPPTGPDPSGPAQFGLCNAWLHGKGKGAHHKRDSTAFKALAKFVSTQQPGMTVTQFCQLVVATRQSGSTGSTAPTTAPDSSTAQGQGHGHGTPPSTEGGTGLADRHSGGASDHGTSEANGASDGHSAAGSGNAGSHRP